MNIICDIGHPAHIHLFKNVLWSLAEKGHKYLITTRDKDVTLDLLQKYGMEYVSFGRRYSNIYGKAYGIFKFDARLLSVARGFDADLFISHGSMYAAHIAALLSRPHISMEDTGNMEQIFLYAPFTTAILTSTCLPRKFGNKQIRYDGYHELAYLHPRHFKPNPSVLHSLGVNYGERFVIMRFVDWKATHDARHSGISGKNKIAAAAAFSKHARVFISAEMKLPPELEKYAVKVSPELMHDLLYYASLYYGESGTMASESAVLGTPAIFLDDDGRFYTNEQEKEYGLVFNYTESLIDQARSIEKAIELLRMSGLKSRFAEKRRRLLSDKIDVSSFVAWFVEEFPASYQLMRQHPDYQLEFRRVVTKDDLTTV